jgi:type II secretory pathway component PulC
MNILRAFLIGSGFVAALSATTLRAEADPVTAARPSSARTIHVMSQERYERLADREQLTAQVNLEPVIRDGSVYGYRIAYLRDGGDLAALGLVANDVIVAVNGGPIDTNGPFVQALDYLDPPFLGSVSFELERRGDRRQVTYVVE